MYDWVYMSYIETWIIIVEERKRLLEKRSKCGALGY